MIVKVTEKNKKDYQKLFDKASYILIKYKKNINNQSTGLEKLLNLTNCKINYGDSFSNLISILEDKDNIPAEDQQIIEDIEIPKAFSNILDYFLSYYVQNLNDYFTVLSDIITLVTDSIATELKIPGGWKYFTMVPLPGEANYDKEPTLKIDANKRTITVPTELKTFGVVGDVISEIIYFEIDRYFDTIDFGSQNLDAVIEWHRLNSDDDEPKRDLVFLRELTLIPGKVLLGWPITKRIAEEAGTIEFSVRFYYSADETDSDISYNFSTLPAKASIANTLNFENINNITDTDIEDFIKARVISVKGENNTSDDVEIPYWTNDINNSMNTNVKQYTDIYTKELIADEYYVDFLQNENYAQIKVSADTKDSNSIIQYQLQYESTGMYKPDAGSDIWNLAQEDNIRTETLSGITTYRIAARNYVGPLKKAYTYSKKVHILDAPKPYVKEYNEEEDKLPYISKYIGDSLEVIPSLSTGKWCDDINDNNNTDIVSFEFVWKKDEALLPEANGQIYVTTEEDAEGMYVGYVQTKRNNTSNPNKSDKGTTYRVTKHLQPLEKADIKIINTENEGLSNPEIYAGKLNDTIIISFADEENGIDYNFDKLYYKWKFRHYPNQEWKYITDHEDWKNYTVKAEGEIISPNELIKLKGYVDGYYELEVIIHRNREIIENKNVFESILNGVKLGLNTGKAIWILNSDN